MPRENPGRLEAASASDPNRVRVSSGMSLLDRGRTSGELGRQKSEDQSDMRNVTPCVSSPLRRLERCPS